MTKDEALKLALEALERFEGNKKLWPEAITAIKEALAQPEQETQGYREAAQLAKWLFKTHYAQEEHYASGRVVWDLCDTTAGVISQIDNMVCKLVLPKEPEQENYMDNSRDLTKPVAWISHNAGLYHFKPDESLDPLPLYLTPPPCPTCEALARTVMMDQTGRDA